MAQQTLGLADDFEAKCPGKKDVNPIHLSEPADNGQARAVTSKVSRRVGG
jgi:hypothetical protein